MCITQIHNYMEETIPHKLYLQENNNKAFRVIVTP